MVGNTNTRMLWIALAAALPVACAVDDNESDPDTSGDVQTVTGVCPIYRPYPWSVGTVSCTERPTAPYVTFLNPGQRLLITSSPVPEYGQGHVVLQCDANGDGHWVEIGKICDPL